MTQDRSWLVVDQSD